MSETSSHWACSRCGRSESDGGRLEFSPWPDALGTRVRNEICGNCWGEWMGVQTKIINEYRLNVLHPEHANAVREQMEVFLGFREQGELPTGTPT